MACLAVSGRDARNLEEVRPFCLFRQSLPILQPLPDYIDRVLRAPVEHTQMSCRRVYGAF